MDLLCWSSMKCISEDIHAKSMTVGKYFIVNPNDEHHPLPDSHKIIVQVMSPQGTMLHEADNTESGQFSFTASETGSYLACITAVDHKPETTLTIDLDWRSGVHSQDWSKVVLHIHVNDERRLFSSTTC
ncbi:PREDICTED: transmembrane emp24 domain-containing protein p24delta8-like [Brassica oleracea var. oleracea]|uniref:transmembrane emp24 domain-containing protein p24delta8-like n=1 Tax=Brassica oleracea var. oleracea TaxID=109376 RepID=UPI0006A6A8A8|nr:PREDICTED: transmembrane emp24 domain-containing protein p24delta8-like [Brassica oleracea var. oleracea]